MRNFQTTCCGRDGLAQAQCTLGALHPTIWRRHEVPRRAPPIPPAVRGIAGLAWVQGRLDVALGVLIGFHCTLCGGEVLGLRFCDCMHLSDTVVLDLGFTKTGSRTRA